MEQVYRTILVGIDGSEQGNAAFRKAVEVARRNEGRVIAAHVIENQLYNLMGYPSLPDNLMGQETEAGKQLLAECQAYAESVDYPHVETVLTFGSAKEAMARELPAKHHVDLIMVGQSGLNSLERVMVGSVSNYILLHAPCDVLVVNPEK
ncbi:universal stress protein [Enterococcus canis]|uniref:Universal stress protein n=1 Tax=Enterococcus canis TaxID=214095 RepID=A0A1L8RES9_9ENTE|nr:universal stress protein [Enterococcus canis]OJG18192.1 universal stress protein [Enterococcus canis]